FVLIYYADHCAVCFKQARLCRRGYIAPGINIMRESGIESNRMASFRLRQPDQSRAVELDAVCMLCDNGMLGPAEINKSGCFIYAVQRARLPFPVRNLANQLAVGRVMIYMLPTASLAEPEKRAVLQPCGLADCLDIDPGLRGLAQNSLRFAVCRV